MTSHPLSIPSYSKHKDTQRPESTTPNRYCKLQQGIGEKSFCIIVVFVDSKTEKEQKVEYTYNKQARTK
jgi:hypothetical protein